MIQKEEAYLSDREWVDAVCQENRGRVYKYIVHQVNDQPLSDDMTQEVFHVELTVACAKALLEKADEVRKMENVAGWLIQTAAYKIMSENKRARNHREVPLTEEILPAAEEEERTAFLEHLPPDLSEDERTLLVYRIYYKLSFYETGKALHCSSVAAQMRFRRLMKRLKEKLGENT